MYFIKCYIIDVFHAYTLFQVRINKDLGTLVRKIHRLSFKADAVKFFFCISKKKILGIFFGLKSKRADVSF